MKQMFRHNTGIIEPATTVRAESIKTDFLKYKIKIINTDK